MVRPRFQSSRSCRRSWDIEQKQKGRGDWRRMKRRKKTRMHAALHGNV